MTRPNSLPLLPPLGCAILFFVFVFFFFVFCFFGFLVSWCFSFWVSWFLVFWFVVGFLKGWQNNTKVKDLDFTLCQFSHFRGCKLAFGWFYWLLWACGSNRKPCKKTWQNAGITGGSLGGLGHRLGNFVCLCNFSKNVLNKCKNIGSQWMCRTDFDIDIVGSTLELTHVQTLWKIPLKKVMHLFEVSVPFNKIYF